MSVDLSRIADYSIQISQSAKRNMDLTPVIWMTPRSVGSSSQEGARLVWGIQ